MGVRQQGMVLIVAMIAAALVAGISIAGMRVAKLDQLILAARYDDERIMRHAENALAKAESEWAALLAKCIIDGCDNTVAAFSIATITLGTQWQISDHNDLHPMGQVTFWGLERNAGMLSLIYEIVIRHAQLGGPQQWHSLGKTSAMQKLVIDEPAAGGAAIHDSIRVQRLTWRHQ